MSEKLNVLILGASYGSLFAMKLVWAGHDATLVCLAEEADRFNAEGGIVRMPVRGVDGLVELRSSEAPGQLRAMAPDAVVAGNYDLVCLAMQEPQYRAPELRRLLAQIAGAGLPTMSIMNMPPLTYLARIPGVDTAKLEGCYTDPRVWDGFDPDLMTLASPDPQAFRPPDEPCNVLQVSLPTNFKVARFADDGHTAMLHRLERDIDAVRCDHDGRMVELPVKLRVHQSVFVPLAKWSMLLTGNYRCVLDDSVRSIAEAVHADVELSRSVYEWVGALCERLGADRGDLVPFEKYANAAMGLAKPSSAARALSAGAEHIERVDALVQVLGEQAGLRNDEVDRTLHRVEAWLARNRAAHDEAA